MISSYLWIFQNEIDLQDFNGLSLWCKGNSTGLNIDKCKLFGFFYNYIISNNLLQRVNVIKELGAFVDSHLKFNYHKLSVLFFKH